MFFYAKMGWDLKGMSFRDLWIAEGEEARHAIKTIEENMVQHLYKVVAEQYVIVIGNLPLAEELDRTAMGRLPMHEHLIFDDVWSLQEGFTIDVQGYLKPRREQLQQNARFLYYVQLAWDFRKRELDEIWEQSQKTLKNFEGGKILGFYRVAGQQRAIMIVDVQKAENLNMLTNLQIFKSAWVEKIWSLRDYHLFAEDVWKLYNI